MFPKAARILSAVAVLVLLVGVRPGVCEGWSLWPFSSDSTTKTKAKKPAAKAAPKQPSTLDKVVAAPKTLFTKLSDTITGKKPKPPKASQMVPIPKGPTVQPRTTEETTSWLPKMFQPKEPEQPKTVADWLAKERLDP